MAIFPGSAIPSAVSGYGIGNSLRFNKGDSPYLARTPGSASNRKTWTMSCWVKLGADDYGFVLMDAGSNPNYLVVYMYQGEIALYDPSVAPDSIYIRTKRILRDPSAWYHIVVQLDTTQSTNTDRVKIYVNNERETEFNNTVWPDEDYESFINNNIEHNINKTGSSAYADCYMAEYYFIDGTALTPSSFAELDSTTNQWVPIDAVDDLTFGTNGFYQKYGATDPYGSATDLLLHMDGSDSGTTFTDATGNHTITRDGVTTTTSDKKFGTASANFNGGTEDNDLIVDHTAGLDFDGDFTIDFWTKVATAAPVLNNRFFQKGSNSATGVTMAMDADNIYFGRSDEVLVSFDRDLVLATGNWHHIAVTRASDNYFRIFLDGVLKDTSSSTYADNLDNSGGLYIGAYPGDSTGDRFDGLIDEFRVAKGIARWTTNFSVPTEAYSSLGLDSSGN